MAQISQEQYFEQLQRLLDDSDFHFVVKQLAILAALKGYSAEEKILAECYEQLARV